MGFIPHWIGELLSNCRLKHRLLFLSFIFLFATQELRAQGGSAVITLVMPVGARQLGMGEAATAVADDAFATYWNPAGLAFGPLANEWEMMLPTPSPQNKFTVMATKPRSGFLLKSIIWAGSQNGLLYYDGKIWRDYYEYVMEQGEQVEKVVRKYIGSSDNLDSLVKVVKNYNHINSAKEAEELISLKLPYNLLFKDPVTALVLDNTERLWVGTAGGLYRFDGGSWKVFDREEGFTMLTEAAKVTPTVQDTLKLDSLKIVKDSTRLDTLKIAEPSVDHPLFIKKAITSLAMKGTSLWIGTDDGLFEYKKSSILRRGQNLLPSQYITAITTHENIDEIYAAVKDKGLARYTPPKTSGGTAKWKIYTTADGLLDSSISQLVLDKFGHVWAAHKNGVSHFSLTAWEKIRFKKQEVHSLALDEDNHIWIGTSEGAWKHTPAYTNAKGRLLAKKIDGKPENDNKGEDKKGDWIHFHTGNGLSQKNVTEIKTQGSDVWFVTEAGIERYNTAKSQVAFFYESLLPVLGLNDLYHAYLGMTFPVEEWGTLGGFINFVSFGSNDLTDASGDPTGKVASYEFVAGLSYGTRLSQDAGLGVNAKFLYSALAPGQSASGEKSDGVAASYAVDLGLLWKNVGVKGFSLALVLQNIGPAVFYVDQAQADPIPFTWKVGTGYEIVHTPNHKLTIAADASREAVFRENNKAAPVYIGAWKDLAYPENGRDLSNAEVFQKNLELGVYNSGLEYVYANVAAFRLGLLYDDSGKRYESDIGLGFMISDILQVDGTFIKSFDQGIRNGQKRFSMILRF